MAPAGGQDVVRAGLEERDASLHVAGRRHDQAGRRDGRCAANRAKGPGDGQAVGHDEIEAGVAEGGDRLGRRVDAAHRVAGGGQFAFEAVAEVALGCAEEDGIAWHRSRLVGRTVERGLSIGRARSLPDPLASDYTARAPPPTEAVFLCTGSFLPHRPLPRTNAASP